MLSMNAIRWGVGVAAAAVAVGGAALLVRLPIAWPGARTPPAVVSQRANSAVATPAPTPAAGLAATPAPTLTPAAGPAATPAPALTPTAAPGNAPATVSEPSPSEPAVQRPTFDVVRVEPTGDAVIAGHAAPKAAIELRADGQVVAQADADASGEFVILPPAFSAGGHRLELAARTGEATAVLSESVPINVPDAVAIPTPAAASAPGSSSAKADVAPPPASAAGSIHPTRTPHILMRTARTTETKRHQGLSAPPRSPAAMPEPAPQDEAVPTHGGGHR